MHPIVAARPQLEMESRDRHYFLIERGTDMSQIGEKIKAKILENIGGGETLDAYASMATEDASKTGFGGLSLPVEINLKTKVAAEFRNKLDHAKRNEDTIEQAIKGRMK